MSETGDVYDRCMADEKAEREKARIEAEAPQRGMEPGELVLLQFLNHLGGA